MPPAMHQVERRPVNLLVDFPGQTAFTRGVIAGVARYCHQHPDTRLRFTSIEWGLVNDPDKVDGVIAMVRTDDPIIPATRFNKPVVNVSAVSHAVPYPTITMDNAAIGQMAAEHLLQQGYRHFAYLLESRVYFSRARLAGFRDHLARHDLNCDVHDTAPLAGETDESIAQVRLRTLRWLEGLPKPVGVFLHTDVRASMLLDLCHQAELAVPEQIGMVGVDNDELVYPFCTPPLTDIDIAPDLIGYRAAEVLISIVNGNAPPCEPILIPPRRLHERASSQPQHLDDEVLASALRFMRQNVGRGLSVAKLLDAVPVTRRSLERRFRDKLRISPAQAIRRLQIERAKDLLMNTNQTLTRVAAVVGYSRFRNFASAFKRETGLAPAAYRRKFRT